MGWKNIKEHYRIGHIVRVRRDGVVCIGSPYISELLLISPCGEVTWGELGGSGNEDLVRYHREMIADVNKLRGLLTAPDVFLKFVPVYTYEGPVIVEKMCEEPGWPHVTHDGQVMYDNLYSTDKATVVSFAKKEFKSGIKCSLRCIQETEGRLEELKRELGGYERALLKLEMDFPVPVAAGDVSLHPLQAGADDGVRAPV